jgi:hypothetical protein
MAGNHESDIAPIDIGPALTTFLYLVTVRDISARSGADGRA